MLLLKIRKSLMKPVYTKLQPWSSEDIPQTPGSESSRPLCSGTTSSPSNLPRHQTIRKSEPVVWGQIFVLRLFGHDVSLLSSRESVLARWAGVVLLRQHLAPSAQSSVAVRRASSEHPLYFGGRQFPENFSDSMKQTVIYVKIYPVLWLVQFLFVKVDGGGINWKHFLRMLDARNMDMGSYKFNCW